MPYIIDKRSCFGGRLVIGLVDNAGVIEDESNVSNVEYCRRMPYIIGMRVNLLDCGPY